MKEDMFWKCLAFGVIVLFIGVSFIPSTTGNIEKINRAFSVEKTSGKNDKNYLDLLKSDLISCLNFNEVDSVKSGLNILMYFTDSITKYTSNQTISDSLPISLSDNGSSITFTDRNITPEIDYSLLEGYDQLWILLTRKNIISNFTTGEIDVISHFKDTGKKVFEIPVYEWLNQNYQVISEQIFASIKETFNCQMNQKDIGGQLEHLFENHNLIARDDCDPAVISKVLAENLLPIWSNQDDETKNNGLVGITIQICKQGRDENHNVLLTQQQATEVENLFNCIMSRLETAKTRQETIAIFNQAAVELDNYGLLPQNMSVQSAQQLLTGAFLNQSIMKFPEKNNLRKIGAPTVYENYNCLIAGRTTRTSFSGEFGIFIKIILSLLAKLVSLNAFFFILAIVIILIYFPYYITIAPERNADIFFGYGMEDWDNGLFFDVPASGWVQTNGLNGKIEWSGEFRGQLGKIIHEWGAANSDWFYKGAEKFTGIKLLLDYNTMEYSFLGYASHINVG